MEALCCSGPSIVKRKNITLDSYLFKQKGGCERERPDPCAALWVFHGVEPKMTLLLFCCVIWDLNGCSLTICLLY